jgi:hypothetical protein
MRFLSLVLSIMSLSATAATQEQLDQLRSRLVSSYNTVSKMSVEAFSKEAQKMLADARASNKPLLAERIEAALELNIRDSVLKVSKDQINSISNNGLFLIGVAICQVIAASNYGLYCFQSSDPYSYGYISPLAFVVLTLVTLGETESGSEF